jgi:hypothetical protein
VRVIGERCSWVQVGMGACFLVSFWGLEVCVDGSLIGQVLALEWEWEGARGKGACAGMVDLLMGRIRVLHCMRRVLVLVLVPMGIVGVVLILVVEVVVGQGSPSIRKGARKRWEKTRWVGS